MGLTAWAPAPRAVRAVALGAVVVLGYGTVVHVVQLVAAGFDPYPEQPTWLRLYFVGLTVLDPLAAVLIARARRSGVVLAVAVLVTDAAANAWADHVVDDVGGLTAGRVGLAVITLLALVLVLTAPRLWQHAARPGAPAGTAPPG